MSICTSDNSVKMNTFNTNISNPYQNNNAYGKLQNYNTPICRPYENKVFLQEEQPTKNTTRNMCRLNNGCQTNENFTYFNERGVKESPFFKSEETKICPNGFVSRVNDARMVDTARNYNQQLDIKPIQVYYNLINDNISGNPELKDYGKNYKSYSTVTGGQIQYYLDKDLSIPFYRPVYAATTKAVGYNWKDPMDSIKPQFEKEYPTESFTSLSWLDDSCSFRDDITALQQRTHNQQNFSMVYDRI
jgi:hypothetical protein